MASLEKMLEKPVDVGAAAREAASQFAVRAENEGLVDVAYTTVESPFGPMVVAGTKRGLVRVAWAWNPAEQVVADLAERISPRVLESPARLDPVRRQLDDYFEGRRREFDLPVDFTLVRGSFTRRVLEATSAVHFGELTTYSEVAGAAGSPRAVRAAGNALGSNPIPIVVPCHRVIRTGGALGGYGGGTALKVRLLGIEGHAAFASPPD